MHQGLQAEGGEKEGEASLLCQVGWVGRPGTWRQEDEIFVKMFEAVGPLEICHTGLVGNR